MRRRNLPNLFKWDMQRVAWVWGAHGTYTGHRRYARGGVRDVKRAWDRARCLRGVWIWDAGCETCVGQGVAWDRTGNAGSGASLMPHARVRSTISPRRCPLERSLRVHALRRLLRQPHLPQALPQQAPHQTRHLP